MGMMTTPSTQLLWRLVLTGAYRAALLYYRMTKRPIRGVMVAVWHRGRLLMIRNSYRKGWSMPGGLPNRKEPLARAAVRETDEEVGIRLAPADLAFVTVAAGEMGPRDRVHIFETEVTGPVDIAIDHREIVEAAFVRPDEALRRPLNDAVAAYLRSRNADGVFSAARSIR